MKILTIDIETTGLRPDTHEIWEVGLAWTSPDGRDMTSRSWLVRPSPDAVWGAVAREMAAGVDLTSAPELADVWPQIEAHLQDAALIVAHGAPFERGFLEAVAAGSPAWLHLKRWVCTLSLAQALLPRPHTLAATCAALGISPPTPAHRAEPDARACLEVLLEMRRRVGLAG
jgi:DNA polymerase III epsilon subunit-like protein